MVDAQGQVRYHGRIDDQFAAPQGAEREPRRRSELQDAIAAVLDGRGGEGAARPGRRLPDPRAAQGRRRRADLHARTSPRSSRRTARNATARARSGRSPLETYEQARKRADDIADGGRGPARCRRGRPSPEVGPKFKHDRSLSDDGDRHARRLGRGRRPGGRPRRPARRRRSSPTTGRSGTPRPGRSTSADDFAIPADGRRHLPLLRDPDEPARRTCTSRRSSTGRATAGSSTTSWPTSTPRARPASATRPTRARATRASPGPASRSTATSAAGPPATSRAGSPTASAGRCPRAPT